MKNCIFSEEAKASLFTEIKEHSTTNPLFNIKLEVTLCIDSKENESKPDIVHVQSTTDIQQSILKGAEFVADMWIDDELPENDNLSVNDLIGAEVKVVGAPTVYYVEFTVRSKVVPKQTPVTCGDEPTWKKHIKI